VIGTLKFLHESFAFALILFAAALGAWGTIGFLTRRHVTGGFRSAYVMMIVLAGIQGALGLILITTTQPRALLHVVYGAFAFLFLPGVYFWAGRGSRPREAAFLAMACWIVAIAFARGVATG